jgi:hypothetical protein
MECRLAGETEVLGRNQPQSHFCPSQNPTWPDPVLDPGRCGGKPTTNCLSYGAACMSFITRIYCVVKLVGSKELFVLFSPLWQRNSWQQKREVFPIVNSTVFCSLDTDRHVGQTYFFYLQGRRLSQAREDRSQAAVAIISNPANLFIFICICALTSHLQQLTFICYYTTKSEGQYDAVSSPAWTAY